MAWLVVEDRVLATLEVAESWRGRVAGLIRKESLEEVLLLRPACAVHTFRVRFPIDVAYCDRNMVVLDIVTMKPNRLGMPRLRARAVLEAPKASFERWKVGVGDQLEIRE